MNRLRWSSIAILCLLSSACRRADHAFASERSALVAGDGGELDGDADASDAQDADAYDAADADADTDSGLDTGTWISPDSGSGSDSGAWDSGTYDSGAYDTGIRDSGTYDAGTHDAGTYDAGTHDAGTSGSGTYDAGARDSGTYDGGDAGTRDAGDCPQLGHGCSALFVNLLFDVDKYWTRELTAFENEAKASGCSSHVYDVFTSGKVRPKPFRLNATLVGGFVAAVYNEQLLPRLQESWADEMHQEVVARDAAWNDHITEVGNGVELAIEHINAHGSDCATKTAPDPSGTCGTWAAANDSNLPQGQGPDIARALGYLDRRAFEEPLWSAARGKVCEHVFVDGSCGSACSVQHGANLNKAAASTCIPQQADDTCDRAGWRGDMWIGSSTSTWSLSNTQINEDMRKGVAGAMSIARLFGAPFRISRLLAFGAFPSKYHDNGYGATCPQAAR